MDPDPSVLLYVTAFLQHAPDASLNAGSLLAGLVTLLVLLLVSAFFSGSEVALFSLSETAREALAEQGDRASLRVLRLLEHPRQVLITILILNTLVNVAASILGALLTGMVAASLQWSPTIILILEIFILTFLLLVLSEITPKLIATRHAPQYSRRSSAVLMTLHRFFYPVSNLLARSTHIFQRRLKPANNRISSDDLKVMADVGEAHGTLEEEERELIYSIVEFGETAVREIMVSRLDIVALPVTASLNEALNTIRASGHSRLPLYVEHLDNILGIIYAKDLLPALRNPVDGQRLDWTRLARPPMFVPLGKKLDGLLKDFQNKKTHIAIVVDEYGGTAGLVTLEDVLEEIVGDIRDEHDEPAEALYERIDEHTYRVDARIDLDDLNDLLGLSLETETFDFETLGGLIYHLSGVIPSPGDEVTHEPLHMRVESIVHHRIGQVLVRVTPSTEETQEHPESRTSNGNA